MKTLNAILLTLFTTLCLIQPTQAQWQVESITDRMTDKEYWIATSEMTEPTEELNFPYRDIQAQLIGMCGERGGYFGVKFNETPNITSMRYSSNGIIINSRIKGDHELHDIDFTYEVGNYTIKVTDIHAQNFINIMINSKQMLVEFEWFREGNVYFVFDLTGSADALMNIADNCNQQLN